VTRLLVTGLLLAAIAVPAARAATSAPAATRDGLCELLDVVLPLQCQEPPPSADGQGAAPASTAAAKSSSQQVATDQARRTPTRVRYDPRRLEIGFRPGTSRKTIDAAFARARVTPEQAIPALRTYMVGVDPARRDSALTSLRASPAVTTAGREVLVDALDVAPNDTEWAQQWGLQLTGFPRAWGLAPASDHVVVAVVDTGVDPAQPDLQGKLVPGYDFIDQTDTPSDDHGHGTAVAGIIAARAGNHLGIAGVCTGCLVMPVKVLDRDGVGDDTVIAAGIVWAVDHGAKVINLSLGGPGVTPSLSDAIAYAVDRGAVTVAAAGNNASTAPFYPAADPHAIGVAATTQADHPYPWSDFGAWVKVAAPGCNLAPLSNGYGSFCGTSAAAPVVAGLAALALAANPTATPEQIEQALGHPALPLPGFVQYGRIDAPATLSLLAPTQTAPTTTLAFRGSLLGRGTRSFVRTLPAGHVTATLTFRSARPVTFSLSPQSPPGSATTVAGTSPLRLQSTVGAGAVKVTVRAGRARVVRFTLTLQSTRTA
jgi:subtilisin family serine protease